MARPSITGKTIVVQVENDLVVWTDGLISSDNKEYVKTAKWLSERHMPISVTIDGPTILCDLNDKEAPEKALAALMGIIPGRGRILQAPDNVLKLLPFYVEEPDEENLWIENEEE